MVYIFLAEGFEEIEALAVCDILRRARIETELVGVSGKTVTGAHGITVICDREITEITMSFAKMIVLPGGMPGTLNLAKSGEVLAAIDYAINNAVYVAAICAAPSILGDMGHLRGKTAVCYSGYEDKLAGAEIGSGNVVVSGNVITGKNAASAVEFALELVTLLKDCETSGAIKSGLSG